MSERAKTLREKLIAAFLAQDNHMNGDGSVKIEDRAEAALSVIAALAEDDAAVQRVKAKILNAAVLDFRTERITDQQIVVTPVVMNPDEVTRAAIRALGE